MCFSKILLTATFRFKHNSTMVKKMPPLERAKALGMLSAGLSIREVARRMGRAKSSIHGLKEKKARSDSVRACQQSPGQGRHNFASLGEVRKIIKMVKASPFITAKKIKDKLGGWEAVIAEVDQDHPPEGRPLRKARSPEAPPD